MALVVGVLLALLWLLSRCRRWHAACRSNASLAGRTALVTGGTSGIGLQIAAELARRGARVLVACPDAAEGAAARRRLVALAGADRVEFRRLDLASLDSVRRFAAGVLASEDRLDLLMNNAGVFSADGDVTADGLDPTMQINYYGHFLLTLLLLPLLRRGARPEKPARVVNTVSLAHAMGDAGAAATGLTAGGDRLRVYGTSKLCLMLFSCEFSRRYATSGVVMNDADPGFVSGTAILGRRTPTGALRAVALLLTGGLVKRPREGAQTPLHAALADEAGAGGGRLFAECREARPSAAACDAAAAAALWRHSLRLVGLTEDELRVRRASALTKTRSV